MSIEKLSEVERGYIVGFRVPEATKALRIIDAHEALATKMRGTPAYGLALQCESLEQENKRLNVALKAERARYEDAEQHVSELCEQLEQLTEAEQPPTAPVGTRRIEFGKFDPRQFDGPMPAQPATWCPKCLRGGVFQCTCAQPATETV